MTMATTTAATLTSRIPNKLARPIQQNNLLNHQCPTSSSTIIDVDIGLDALRRLHDGWVFVRSPVENIFRRLHRTKIKLHSLVNAAAISSILKLEIVLSNREYQRHLAFVHICDLDTVLVNLERFKKELEKDFEREHASSHYDLQITGFEGRASTLSFKTRDALSKVLDAFSSTKRLMQNVKSIETFVSVLDTSIVKASSFSMCYVSYSRFEVSL